MLRRAIGVLLASLLASTAAEAGNGFKSMAKEISKAARKAGMARVAVLSFIPADGSSANDGWNLAEKLTTQVVRAGQVQTVERSLLKKLLEEHGLGKTGLLDPFTLKKLGKVFSVEGVITGSFVTVGAETVVQARLINIETGVIVLASEGRVEREGFEAWNPAAGFKTAQASLWVPVPELIVEAPSFAEGEMLALRDSVSDESCANAAERVDALNKNILDLKARYWALRLKNGLSLTSLKHNPGSEISDPLLKREFYGRMKAWYTQEEIPALTPSEVKRFVDVDSQAFGLYGKCGV